MAKKKATTTKKTPRKTSKSSPAQRLTDTASLESKLQSLLDKEDSKQRVIRLLMSQDESVRRDLFPICKKQYQKLRKQGWIENPPGTFRQNPLLPVARVAVFCTANHSELSKLGNSVEPQADDILKILEKRKPKWCDQFVQRQLQEGHYWINWRLCRELIRRGLCAKPDHPHYYTGMITGLIGRFNRTRKTALKELRKDPNLLKDEVWKLFEYEGDGENTLANVDRFEKADWSGALVTLSREGKLSRNKLLDAALGALELGFNHYRARWFYEFFDAMEPNDRELKKRMSTIQNLIGSPTPNIAQWAFDKQQQAIDAGLIKDMSSVIDASTPLLSARHKKSVVQVISLFDRIAKDFPPQARQACLAITEALGHEKADVQKKAFTLIQHHGSPDDADLRQGVERYASIVAATLRKNIESWLGPSGSTDQDPSAPRTAASGRAAGRPKTSTKRLQRFADAHVKRLRLDLLADSSGAAASPTTAIPATVFNGTEIPRLSADRMITPIADFDELLETLGRVIEDDSLIDDSERALDGLARLHCERPNDFDERIGPLFQRAQKLLKRHCDPFAGQSVAADLCGLICIWKNDAAVEMEITEAAGGNQFLVFHGLADTPIKTWVQRTGPTTFMSRRMLDVSETLLSGQPHQLLSTPTHQGGWIDAFTLVERLNQVASPPAETDVILAMLRLAPDHRAAALKKLRPKQKGEWVEAFKHALGAKSVRIGKSAPFWAAAARCRAPFADDPQVTQAFPSLGPGAGKALRFDTRFEQVKRSYGVEKLMFIEPLEKSAQNPAVHFPTLMRYANHDSETTLSFHDIGTSPGSIRWLASMWPLDPEPFFAAGAMCIGTNLDWWEAAWHNRCFLEPLLDPDVPLLEMGRLLLLCGLAAKEPGEHGLAVDVVIQAMQDGRLGSDNLTDMLVTAMTSGHFNLQRLAKRFHDVAAISDLHAYITLLAVEAAVPHVDLNAAPRGLGDLFELLTEIGSQLNRGIMLAECRTFLEGIKGSNKVAKAAKELLSLQTRMVPSDLVEQAIGYRTERLEQWTGRDD